MSKPCLSRGVYFHGCAWAVGFYVGVLQAMDDTYGAQWHCRHGRRGHRSFQYWGDSIGGLVAMTMALELDTVFLDRLCRSLIGLAAQHPFAHLRSSDVHNEAIDMVLEEASRRLGAHVDVLGLLRARLHIGVTEHVACHRWGTFDTIDELRNLMHGSFHIPVYCRAISQRRTPRGSNRWFVDGAFSFCPYRDLPNHGAHTMVVGVVGDEDDGWCDLHPPRPYTRAHCLMPDESRYDRMCEDGRRAASVWLRAGGVPKIKTPRSPQHLILALVWPLRAFEEYVLVPYKRSRL